MTNFRICQVECRRIVFISCFVCLWPGFFFDLWRVVPCFCHWSALAIRVGGQVACPVVVFSIIVVRGSRFLSLIYTGDSGWVVCPEALFAKWFMALDCCR